MNDKVQLILKEIKETSQLVLFGLANANSNLKLEELKNVMASYNYHNEKSFKGVNESLFVIKNELCSERSHLKAHVPNENSKLTSVLLTVFDIILTLCAAFLSGVASFGKFIKYIFSTG